MVVGEVRSHLCYSVSLGLRSVHKCGDEYERAAWIQEVRSEEYVQPTPCVTAQKTGPNIK